jgi:hypothetical protein
MRVIHAINVAAAVGVLAVLAFQESSGGEAEPGQGSAVSVPERQKGVCLVGGRKRPTDGALDKVSALGVNWISQTPFGWQRRHDDPELRMATGGRVWWGESDEGLVDTARRAQERGMQTVLKPHIWIRDRDNGKWRGEIDFDTDADWDTWWERYRTFALHYARLAEQSEMAVYCIGTELRSSVLKRPERWRELIAEIRTVYSGSLTYSANWYREFEEVPFWDALDYIGLQAYFPLAEGASDEIGLEVLLAGWAAHLKKIERVQLKYGKPVLLTEVGYRSTQDAATEPWRWRSDADPDNALQARCYEAMFRTFWDKGWLAGLYIWKWYPDDRMTNRRRHGFTPQGKPAEQVLREWYLGDDEP